MIGGKFSGGGGGIAYPITQAEEDVDACLDWAGCGGIRTEVGDGITIDGILLIVKGDDNFCGIAEIFGGGVHGE